MKVLRVSIASNPPFGDCVVRGIPGARMSRGQCFGIEPALLEMFADRLNVTLEYVLLFGDSWGSPLPNGSWTGHIGRILRGEADTAIGAVTQTHARSQAVDFAPMVLEDKRTFLAQGPAELPKATAFFRPFDVRTWVLIGLCFAAVRLTDQLLAVVVKRLQRETSRQGRHETAEDDASDDAARFAPWSSKEGQYHNRIAGKPFPRNVILHGSFHIFVAVLSWMYSAIILASLLNPQYQPAFDTMESAVTKLPSSSSSSSSPKTRQRFVTTIFDGALREYFSPNSNSQLIRRVLDEGRLTVCPESVRVCSDPRHDFMFITYETALMWKADFERHQGLSTVLSKDKMLISGMAWPLSKTGDPWLKQKLADLIGAAHSGGLVAYLHKQGLRSGGTMKAGSARDNIEESGHQDDVGDHLKTLGMGEFEGAFLAFGIGIAASGLAFVWEMAAGCWVVGRRDNRRCRNALLL